MEQERRWGVWTLPLCGLVAGLLLFGCGSSKPDSQPSASARTACQAFRLMAQIAAEPSPSASDLANGKQYMASMGAAAAVAAQGAPDAYGQLHQAVQTFIADSQSSATAGKLPADAQAIQKQCQHVPSQGGP